MNGIPQNTSSALRNREPYQDTAQRNISATTLSREGTKLFQESDEFVAEKSTSPEIVPYGRQRGPAEGEGATSFITQQLLGERLRDVRIQIKPELSVNSLASKAGIDPSLVRRLESGKSKTFRWESLIKVAKALDKSIPGLLNPQVKIKDISSFQELPTAQEVGERIGKLQGDKSNQQIAVSLGIHYSLYYSYKIGLNFPGLTLINGLAYVLDVPLKKVLDDLFGSGGATDAAEAVTLEPAATNRMFLEENLAAFAKFPWARMQRFRTAVGQAFDQALREKELNVKKLADATGLSPTAVLRIKNGDNFDVDDWLRLFPTLGEPREFLQPVLDKLNS